MKVKLIRDRLGEQRDDTRPANSREGRHLALCLKLHEEAGEIAECAVDPAEYADLLQVMLDLAELNGVPWADIEAAFRTKRIERGGFRRGMIMVREHCEHQVLRDDCNLCRS